jgi:hypothetical protein
VNKYHKTWYRRKDKRNVTRRRVRRRKQLLDDLRKRDNTEKEALDRNVWRTSSDGDHMDVTLLPMVLTVHTT